MTATALERGFDNPVLQSQLVFRRALQALSQPGTVIGIAPTLTPPPPLERTAAALGLTLLDFEVRFHVSSTLGANPAVAEFLKFHTGAQQTTTAAAAAFSFMDVRADDMSLADFAQGTLEYPDRSATVIVQCRSVTDGPALTIAGPGIKKHASLRIAGLPADFVTQWALNRAAFPLGVDILFASGDAFVGLPRSTRIVEAGA